MSENTKSTTFENELKEGRSIAFFTVGVSMRPLLRERETHVMIAPISEAVSGDILLYVRACGTYVLHRCMKSDSEHYYMRGDNTYGYERIKKEQAIGVVTHIYRRGKSFDTTNPKYRAYVAIWNLIYPFRFFLWKLKDITRRVLKRLTKEKK